MTEYKLTGPELQSMLKSNVAFNGLVGIDDESLRLTEDDIKWWRDAKFGLFVHWGVYALYGSGEWVYFNQKIDEEEYRRAAMEEFTPNRTPEEITDGWLSMAKDAGMNYAVMVTRHHDGFAMWDSKCSHRDFTSKKFGPKADYVRAFTDSCRSFGLHPGLYYSPMDWRFPGYFDPEGLPENAQLMKEQCWGQIRELMTDYGRIDILWYDGGWLAHKGSDADGAPFWESVKLNRMARELQPKILMTPRSGTLGDFQCDEGPAEVKGRIVPMPWEKNMSISRAFGYIENDSFHSADSLIVMLSNVVCRDGNMLLNIGPDKNGDVCDEVKETFHKLGDWLRANGEAVYKTRGRPLEPVDRVYGTTKTEDAVYIHVLDKAEFSKITLPALDTPIISAEVLNGEKIEFSSTDNGTIKLSLPESFMNRKEPVTIIKLKIK